MKKIFSTLLITILLLSSVYGQSRLSPIQTAEAVNKNLIQNKPELVVDYLAPQLQEKLNSEALKKMWEQLQSQFGRLSRIYNLNLENSESNIIYTSVFVFDNMELQLKLTLNDSVKIVGLFFVPYENPDNYQAPTYQIKENYDVTSTEIICEYGPLKAEYISPKGKKLFPCVVLVHGSGPHDLDETINGKKPFKDIAIGLANFGIASLRYTKRTAAYKAECFKINYFITPQEETITDAINAIKKAKTLNGIDTNKIFLFGHSLGAMLAPRILNRTPEIKGGILACGNSRKFEDLILEQYTFILSVDSLNDDEKRKLKDLKAQCDLVKSKDLSINTPMEKLPLQLNANYWMFVNNYNQVKEAEKLSQPLLIIGASKDYQVTEVDFNGWKKGLREKKNVTYLWYDGLYHLLMKGDGNPSDYDRKDNVKEQVVKDIADWMLKQ